MERVLLHLLVYHPGKPGQEFEAETDSEPWGRASHWLTTSGWLFLSAPRTTSPRVPLPTVELAQEGGEADVSSLEGTGSGHFEPFLILGRSHPRHTPDSLTIDCQFTWPLQNCVS